MLGGLGAFIASEVSGAARRSGTVYGLYALAGLLFFCAAGYGVNALYIVLSLRYGAFAASLWIAGGLVLAALLALGIATYVKNKPRPRRQLAATALLAAPLATRLGARAMRSRKGWRAAALIGVIGAGILIGRQFFGGDNDPGDEA